MTILLHVILSTKKDKNKWNGYQIINWYQFVILHVICHNKIVLEFL